MPEMFENWLAAQTGRQDAVGALARRVVQSGTSLKREMGSREGCSTVNRAVAEWRQTSSSSAGARSGAGRGVAMSSPAAPVPAQKKNPARGRGGEPCPCGCRRLYRGKVPTGAALDEMRERHRQVDEHCRAGNVAAGLSDRVRTARSR